TRTSAQKTAAMLMKKYDIGLSQGMAMKIATLADTATSHITQKPRYYGFGLGIALTAIMMGVYYFVLRAMIAGHLPDPAFDVVLDALPVLVGGLITTMCIQAMAGQAVRK